MEDVITTEWQLLYTNNPKIQYFGVIKDKEVIWQTNNWNLVKDVEDIRNAVPNAKSRLSIDKVNYDRIQSTDDYYIGTSQKNKGHLIICRIEEDAWVVSKSTPDSVYELARIDVARTAVKLIGFV
jgi:hypothetical protein